MHKAVLMAASAAMFAFPVSGRAQDLKGVQGDPRVPALEEQVRQMQAELAALKKGQETRIGLDNGRLTVTSADGDFSLSLRALIQYDYGYFAQSRGPAAGPLADLSSGSNFRRAQIGVAGTAWRDFSYNFTLDFAGNGVEKSGYIYNAYVQYDARPFAIRIGAYTPPGGIEDQTGSGDLIFLERPSAVDAARNLAGSPSRTAVTLFHGGDTHQFAVSYTGNKVGDSGAFDEQQAVVGRAAWLPLDAANAKWLLDATFTHVFKPADVAPGAPVSRVSFSAGPELAVDNNGPRTVDTALSGAFDAKSVTILGLESALACETLYFQGGWFRYGVQRRAAAIPDPDFNGWYAAATWSLTGEAHPYDAATATFRGLRPRRGLGSGGLGAWEVKARYSHLDLDFDPLAAPAAGGVAGGVQDVWTLGVNWYVTNGIRLSFEYDNIKVNHIGIPANDVSADGFGLRTQLSL